MVRRRSPGLRREEVAMLSDVSATWYTWLEQGRPIRISSEALERIANVLRLDDDETAHLFVLAGVTRVNGVSAAPALDEMRSWLESLGDVLAYVANSRCDLLLANHSFNVVLGTQMQEDGLAQNVAEAIFVGGALRRGIVDFDSYARHFVAYLRCAYGRNANDPQFRSVVDRCFEASDVFQELWSDYLIEEQGLAPLIFHFAHPHVGELVFSRMAFQPMRAHDAIITMLVPVENTGTREKIAFLTDRHKSANPAGAPRSVDRVRV